MTAAGTEPLIGVINAGSSSLKFSVYEGEGRLISGQVEGVGVHPSASAVGPDGAAQAPPDFFGEPPSSPSEALATILPWLREQLGGRRLAALGHRVVHGGLRHSEPALVTPELLGELDDLVPLAPLHEPHNLAPIRMAMRLNPELPQILLRHRLSSNRLRGRSGIRLALRPVRGGGAAVRLSRPFV
jgi:acetate kinase